MLNDATRRKVTPQQLLADLTALSNAQLERLMPQVLCARARRALRARLR